MTEYGKWEQVQKFKLKWICQETRAHEATTNNKTE